MLVIQPIRWFNDYNYIYTWQFFYPFGVFWILLQVWFCNNFLCMKKKSFCELGAFAYTSQKHKMKVMWRLSIACDIFRTNMVDTIIEMWRCAKQSFWEPKSSSFVNTNIKFNMFNTLMKYINILFGNNHAQWFHVHWTHCIAKCALDHGHQLKKDGELSKAFNDFQS